MIACPITRLGQGEMDAFSDSTLTLFSMSAVSFSWFWRKAQQGKHYNIRMYIVFRGILSVTHIDDNENVEPPLYIIVL